MKRKSILMKITLIVLPTFLVAMVSIMLLSYESTKTIVTNQINNEMTARLNDAIDSTSKKLTEHARVAQALAKTIETSHQIYTKDNYITILQKIITINDDTLGSGVFFEPYTYDKSMKFFGPYAYKDGGNIVYTDDLSKPDYNYFSFQWYQSGMDASKRLVWSEPFYDTLTKLNLVTAVANMVDSNNHIIGVATADMDLTNLQSSIQKIKIGQTGNAILFQRNGVYVVADDKSKIFKIKVQDEKNASLAAAGKVMLASNSGITSYVNNGTKYRIYYSTVTGSDWVLALSISENELMQPVNALLIKTILMTVVFMIIVALITFLSIRQITVSLLKAINHLV